MNDRDIEDTRQPKDDVEQEYCDHCGKEMEEVPANYRAGKPYFKCTNPFCPDEFGLHNQLVRDMANHLADVEQKLEDCIALAKSWKNIASVRQQEIERLDNHVLELTPSQSNVVVRNTEYQIRRMNDAIEYLETSSCPDFQVLHKEWNEVKKILESYG